MEELDRRRWPYRSYEETPYVPEDQVENAVDLETALIPAAEVYAGYQGDTLTVGMRL